MIRCAWCGSYSVGMFAGVMQCLVCGCIVPYRTTVSNSSNGGKDDD